MSDHFWLPSCAAQFVQGTVDDFEFEDVEPAPAPRPSTAELIELISNPSRGLLHEEVT